MPIPEFRPDGYLPLGLHLATQEEVAQRFGNATARRRGLMERVSEWLVLARTVRAHRLLLDGSFVTAKPDPGDVDAVCWLPSDFEDRYLAQAPEAIRLYGYWLPDSQQNCSASSAASAGRSGRLSSARPVNWMVD
jgi:hypothetical protein